MRGRGFLGFLKSHKQPLWPIVWFVDWEVYLPMGETDSRNKRQYLIFRGTKGSLWVGAGAWIWLGSSCAAVKVAQGQSAPDVNGRGANNPHEGRRLVVDATDPWKSSSLEAVCLCDCSHSFIASTFINFCCFQDPALWAGASRISKT